MGETVPVLGAGETYFAVTYPLLGPGARRVPPARACRTVARPGEAPGTAAGAVGFVSEASATLRPRHGGPDDGDREARGDAATRRAAGAQPDRPHAPPGVRAPDPARPRCGDRGVGGARRGGVAGARPD